MREAMKDVAEFHRVADVPVRDTPGLPLPRAVPTLGPVATDAGFYGDRIREFADAQRKLAAEHRDERCLRMALLAEEFGEYLEAEGNHDIVEIADGLAGAMTHAAKPVCISFNTNGDTSEWTSVFEPQRFAVERVWAQQRRVEPTTVKQEDLDASIYLPGRRIAVAYKDDWLPLRIPLVGYDEWYRYHHAYGAWLDRTNDGEEGEPPLHPSNKLALPLVVDPLRIRLNAPDSRYLTITVEGHTVALQETP